MLICGHRGSPSNSPENTLASFKIAIDAGVDMLEFDVHKCKSGEIVVIHDKDISRTTNGFGKIADLTYNELQEFDAGNGEKIPLLQEVIELCEKNNIIALIEIKAGDAAIPIAEFIKNHVASGKNTYDKLVVISFQPEILLDVKSIDLNIKIGLTFKDIKIDILEKTIEKLQPYSVNPCIDSVTKEMVDIARKNGLRTFSWTVNSISQYQKARALGADAIMSDFPEMMIDLVKTTQNN